MQILRDSMLTHSYLKHVWSLYISEINHNKVTTALVQAMVNFIVCCWAELMSSISTERKKQLSFSRSEAIVQNSFHIWLHGTRRVSINLALHLRRTTAWRLFFSPLRQMESQEWKFNVVPTWWRIWKWLK